MIYLVRSFLCDKERKLYHTHVIDPRQESQLIVLFRDNKLVWDWYSLRGSSKRWARMSQDVGMRADSNVLSARSQRLCASGFVTAGRKLQGLWRGLTDRPQNFACTILARPQTRVHAS